MVKPTVNIASSMASLEELEKEGKGREGKKRLQHSFSSL